MLHSHHANGGCYPKGSRMSIASATRRMIARHWTLLATCAVFLGVATLTLDDYPTMWDGEHQRVLGEAVLDYLAGDGESAFDQLLDHSDRYYGAAFEAPLVLIERIPGLDTRDVYRSRHILTHLFFLTGGVFCYLLAWRLLHSRALALLAMVLFLLHPRIYAHSFFNSKDVPFLAMFMVSLYLIHRAFRRDTLTAFILCGAGVGLLVNLRIMGLVLFAAVLAMRALDLVTARGAVERRRVLLTGGAFALTAILTFHASMPVLWTDPVGRFAEMIRMLNSHPVAAYNLFRGYLFYSVDGLPFDFVPVWAGITTPPAVLLLALIGAVAIAWRGLRRPRDVLPGGPLRFGLLLLALPLVVVVVIVVLGSNLHDGWRQLHFLYAPLPLLAAFGLQWLASPAHGRGMRVGAYALAGVGIAVVVVSVVRIHPLQGNYFNALTDRTTPERLASRYDFYWTGFRQAILGEIIADHPSGHIHAAIPLVHRPWFLPADGDRERFVLTSEFRSGEINYHAFRDGQPCPSPLPEGAYAIRLYASTFSCVVDPVAWFGGLRQRALATEPLDRSYFDAYRVDDVLVYVRDACSPDDARTRFFLHVHPVDTTDLPDPILGFLYRREYGFQQYEFAFDSRGARSDGNCVATIFLPDYPIAHIDTGQHTPEYAEAVWRSLARAEPLARSRFDVYRDGHTLIWVRDQCSAGDIGTRFFLHVYPVDARRLPFWREEHGFDVLNFRFTNRGARTEDDRCVVTAPLPRYPIASIHTGQYLRADVESKLWDVRFAVTRPGVDVAALTGEPLARSVFDIHRDGDALVYVGEACTAAEATPRFFLHLYPVDVDDLPAARREHGFGNRDFFLWERGGLEGGRCVAVVPLPDYPVASVHTGQYDDAGWLWSAEFPLAPGE